MKEIGNYLIAESSIYVQSLSDNNRTELQKIIQNKYTFIDFWGSWCGPCIHSIPFIKQLYEKTKDRTDVLVLGIALEKKESINALNQIIEEKQILYPNYYVLFHNQKSLNYPHAVYQVQSFPTYLILDKKGAVIHKINHSEDTEKAVSLFLDLIE